MRNRIAALLCALVLLAGVPLALSAQITTLSNTSGSIDAKATASVSSFTKAATQGLFSTDLDTAFDITGFSAFDGKSFGFLDYSSSSTFNLGYSTSLGSMYIGAVYSGSIIDDDTGTSSNSFVTTDLLNANGTYNSSFQTTQKNDDSGLVTSANKLGVLLGFGKIGISASLYEKTSLRTSNYNSIFTSGMSDSVTPDGTGKTVTTDYTPTTSGSTNWMPIISVGTELALSGDMKLKPSLSLGANIHTNDQNASYVTYTQYAGSGLPTYNSLENISSYTSVTANTKEHYFTGLGKLGANLSTGPWSFGASYQFESPFFSSSYIGTDGTTAGTVSGSAATTTSTSYSATSLTSTSTTTVHSYTASPTSEFLHTISPSVGYSADIVDRVKASISFEPTFTLDYYSYSSTTNSVTTKVVADSVTPTNGYTETTTLKQVDNSKVYSKFKMSPVVNAAVQVALINKVLNLNLGATMNFADFYTTTTTNTDPGYTSTDVQTIGYNGVTTAHTYTTDLGTVPRNDNSTTTFDVSSFAQSLNWGLSWVLAPGVTLDTKLGNSGVELYDYYFFIQLSIKK